MTDAKPRKLSEILGRPRTRPKILIAFDERPLEGEPYLVEVEISTMNPLVALGVARAVFAVAGPVFGRLLTGGGLFLGGKHVNVAQLAAMPGLWSELGDSLSTILEGLEPGELETLAVAALAGCTRFRVTVDPDAREPDPATRRGIPCEWIEVSADPDEAKAQIDDLFPSVRHLVAAAQQSFELNVGPISAAGGTKDASSAAKT